MEADIDQKSEEKEKSKEEETGVGIGPKGYTEVEANAFGSEESDNQKAIRFWLHHIQHNRSVISDRFHVCPFPVLDIRVCGCEI
jgi:hypothetical protein